MGLRKNILKALKNPSLTDEQKEMLAEMLSLLDEGKDAGEATARKRGGSTCKYQYETVMVEHRSCCTTCGAATVRLKEVMVLSKQAHEQTGLVLEEVPSCRFCFDRLMSNMSKEELVNSYIRCRQGNLPSTSTITAYTPIFID